MRWLLGIVISLTVMGSSQLAVAREPLLEAMIKEIKVTGVTPGVLEQLNKANPKERSSLEEAIRTGNLFIPQHFSGNAYDSTLEDSDWMAEVGPLIGLGREQWEQQYSGLMKARTILERSYFSNARDKHEANTTRLTCPHFSLNSVSKNMVVTTLSYKTTSVGTLIHEYPDDLFHFNSEGEGDTYVVSFELDHYTSLVTKVILQDTWQTESYTRPEDFMNRYHTEHPVVNIPAAEQVARMVNNYKSTIQNIEASVARVCK